MNHNIGQLFCVFSLMIVLMGCKEIEQQSSAPESPESVPNAAVWVGGLDGGVFVLATWTKDTGPAGYRGEIYYQSGDVAYRGPLELYPDDAADFDPGNTEVYQGWDGDVLYLTAGRELRSGPEAGQ